MLCVAEHSTEAAPAQSATDKHLAELFDEAWALVRTYLDQELARPAKAAGRFVAYGLGGALLGGIGLALVAVGGLRAIQTEGGPTFGGAHSWMPYLMVAASMVLVASVAVLRVARGRPR